MHVRSRVEAVAKHARSIIGWRQSDAHGMRARQQMAHNKAADEDENEREKGAGFRFCGFRQQALKLWAS
jgi:hypothetical protein